MALQFNPPDWAVQEYLNRKTPYQEAAIGVQTGLQNYLAIDEAKRRNTTQQREWDQRDHALKMQQMQMGYDPNNPQAYFDRWNADRQKQDALTQSQTDENTARANYYNRMGPGAKSPGFDKPPTGFRWKDNGDLEPIPGGPAEAKNQKDTNKIDTTLEFYEQAKKGLLAGLESSTTGPIAGRLPAFTAAQQTAQGGVAAMAPALKQIFRVAGEGTFTDRDQALLMEMVPTRADRPEAARAKIQNIDNIVRAKLGKPLISGGLDPSRRARLEELRRKKAEGKLR